MSGKTLVNSLQTEYVFSGVGRFNRPNPSTIQTADMVPRQKGKDGIFSLLPARALSKRWFFSCFKRTRAE